MGSFAGHALPGSFFFIFGLWYVMMALRRHFRCRQTQQPFYATVVYPFPDCLVRRMRNVPAETVVKMLLSGVGIIGELASGLSHVKYFITNAQHITMYFFFGLSGVFDILVVKDLAPEGTDYAAAMLAFLVEGALFKFHLYGRDQLDVLLHILLLYTIGFTVIVVGMEAACRKYSLLPVLRGLLLMVQGTWFWGVGFILYNPLPDAQPWDPEDHHALMLAVLSFSWIVAVNLLLVIVVGVVMGCCYRNRAQYSKINTALPDVLEMEEEESLLGMGGGTAVVTDGGVTKKGTYLSGRDDDLSDLEFEAPVTK